MLEPNSDLGTIKLTLQKFYRINGGSTQRKGVESDISLPDIYEYSKLREKDNPDALPYDEIQKADFATWKYSLNLDPIKKASADRMSHNEGFNKIKTTAQWLSAQNDKVYTLSLKKYQEEQKQIKAAVKVIEASNKLSQEIAVEALPEDLKKYEYDTGKLERFKQWVKNLRTDIYLGEAVNVATDQIAQSNL